jgi:hypothetical protein
MRRLALAELSFVERANDVVLLGPPGLVGWSRPSGPKPLGGAISAIELVSHWGTRQAKRPGGATAASPDRTCLSACCSRLAPFLPPGLRAAILLR